MGFLCKYLRSFGWNPIIITEYLPQKIYNQLSDNQNVTYINFYYSKNKIIQKIKYIFVFFTDFFFNFKDFIIEKKAKQIVENQNISLILCSTARVFPMIAAQKLGEKHKIPVVADLRDIFEQSPYHGMMSKRTQFNFINKKIAGIIQKKLLKRRNKVLPKFNTVTTISKWHVQTLLKYNSSVKLIFNGFDPDLFFHKTIRNDKFTIIYVGRLHNQALRDPSLLFEAVTKLFSEKKLDFKNFKIKFFLTDEKSKKIVAQLIEDYTISNLVEILDTVQNTQIPQILNESSILLLLANKSTGENAPKGIMGTKVFEYLAVEKPILCVRNDEACLEETINCANAGISCSTRAQVENFILEKYAEWQTFGYTHQLVNKEYISQFSRKKQAEQFVSLFNELTKKDF
jgi:glycosyltransferase involved in cell wall biosynthesis